ncbi:unnamed protein product, partial [Ectocarpus fasciculatus]
GATSAFYRCIELQLLGTSYTLRKRGGHDRTNRDEMHNVSGFGRSGVVSGGFQVGGTPCICWCKPCVSCFTSNASESRQWWGKSKPHLPKPIYYEPSSRLKTTGVSSRATVQNRWSNIQLPVRRIYITTS